MTKTPRIAPLLIALMLMPACADLQSAGLYEIMTYDEAADAISECADAACIEEVLGAPNAVSDFIVPETGTAIGLMTYPQWDLIVWLDGGAPVYMQCQVCK